MSKSIPLGKKLSDMIHVSEISPEKEHYPDLCIESDERALAEMPDEGTATIRYKVVSRTHREERRNGKGGKQYSCSLRLEVLELTPPEKKKKNGDSDGGARKALNDYFDKR